MRTRAALLFLIAGTATLPAAPAHAARIRVEVVASDLEFPTNLAFAPDGRMFFTEKVTGRVRIIAGDALQKRPFAHLRVDGSGESGLLGIAVDPRFPTEPYVYLYASRSDRNRLYRMRADGDRGTGLQILLTGLEVAGYHNGGDITFGPDGKLYVVVGEGHDMGLAQDSGSVGGKVLRLNPDGSFPDDNPFGGDSPVYSLGHRNSFGLCFDPKTGNLWETENGPESHDEVNLVRGGENYGWPEVSGPGGGSRFVDPVLDYPSVIVPTGCAFYDAPYLGRSSRGALFFGDFGGNLHRAVLSEDRRSVTNQEVILDGLPGITDVEMGPDGRLYVVTDESILRLPKDVPQAAPPPGPLTPAPTARPPTGESPLTWILAALGGALVAGALTLLIRRKRSGR